MKAGHVFAHRGFHFSKLDENSLCSFRRASISPEFVGFECDVHLSADKIPVIVHDATLLRTHNLNNIIKESTWLQLEAHIPSAESVLAKFGSSNHIIFDLKTETSTDTMLTIKIIDTLASCLNTVNMVTNYSYLVWQALPDISSRHQVLLACNYVFDASDLPQHYAGFACKFDGSCENRRSIDVALEKHKNKERELHINLYAPDSAQIPQMLGFYRAQCSFTI